MQSHPSDPTGLAFHLRADEVSERIGKKRDVIDLRLPNDGTAVEAQLAA